MNGHARLGLLRLLEHQNPLVGKTVVSCHEHSKHPYPRCGRDRRIVDLVPRNFVERRHPDEHVNALSEIVAAADVFDALNSKRAYKKPMTKDEIENIMRKDYTGNQKYVDMVLDYK